MLNETDWIFCMENAFISCVYHFNITMILKVWQMSIWQWVFKVFFNLTFFQHLSSLLAFPLRWFFKLNPMDFFWISSLTAFLNTISFLWNWLLSMLIEIIPGFPLIFSRLHRVFCRHTPWIYKYVFRVYFAQSSFGLCGRW